jgi:hypothetical protein
MNFYNAHFKPLTCISFAKPEVAGHSLIVLEILGAVLFSGTAANQFFYQILVKKPLLKLMNHG